MKKQLISNRVRQIGEQYLKHEFRKIFADIKDESTRKKIDKSVETFLTREGEDSFWNLLFGISEGWKLKQVAHNLSDTRFSWKLENFPIDQITFTGMHPILDEYVIKKYKRNPRLFREGWKKDPEMRKRIEALKTTGFSEYPERDRNPIFLFQRGKEFLVFDGMRRTLLATIAGKKEIPAWVGYEVNKKGKPSISTSRAMFLLDVLKMNKKEDREREEAVINLGKVVSKSYRNGKEVLKKRIAGWSHDPNTKRIFKEMLGK